MNFFLKKILKSEVGGTYNGIYSHTVKALGTHYMVYDLNRSAKSTKENFLKEFPNSDANFFITSLR